MWHENMLGYLFADFTFFEKRTIFREQSSRKTVRFSEQIMSASKYLSIFSYQMKALVYLLIPLIRRFTKLGQENAQNI